MLLSIALLLITILLELSLWLSGRRNLRWGAWFVLILLIPTTSFVAIQYFNLFTVLFLVVAAYRAVNLWRFALHRRQVDLLYSLCRRASFWFMGAQLLALLLTVKATTQSLHYGFWGLAGVAAAGAIVLFFSSQRNLYKTRPGLSAEAVASDELPTVSILIPARNETDDLSACLQALIDSNYPKLEIIVLDDCSQNKRTPEIIKGFAHDGVRFIAGGVPPSSWLAKNHAYDQLTKAASGDLLLFCGVDTRFKPETLGIMVSEMMSKRKTMISFLPANQAPKAWQFETLMVQPSRYAWELALPRRVLDRPPVLSTAWLIRRETLRAAGGFKSAARSATPERLLARYAAVHGDGYSFQQSDTLSGVGSVKSFEEQRLTAIRTRYPQLHQSLELTALVSLAELVILVLPFILYVLSTIYHQMTLFVVVDVVCILLIVLYCQISNLTFRRFLVRSVWLLPFAALYDIALLNYSMYKYEFSTVEWKGRNVCIPVMQVIEHLPDAA